MDNSRDLNKKMLPLPNTILQDGVIQLRNFQSSDHLELFRLSQEDGVLRWVMRPVPFTEEASKSWISDRESARLSGEQLTLAIADHNRNLMGAIWLNRLDWVARRGELAYWIGNDFRQRGLTNRAIRLFSAWIFQTLGLIRLEILAPVENIASQKVAEKAGFTREGILRKYRSILGEQVDIVIFSKLLDDEAQQKTE